MDIHFADLLYNDIQKPVMEIFNIVILTKFKMSLSLLNQIQTPEEW